MWPGFRPTLSFYHKQSKSTDSMLKTITSIILMQPVNTIVGCCTALKFKKRHEETHFEVKIVHMYKSVSRKNTKKSLFVQCHLPWMGPYWGTGDNACMYGICKMSWLLYRLTVRQQIMSQEPDSPVEQPHPKSCHCPQQFFLLLISSRSWPELALQKWYCVYIST